MQISSDQLPGNRMLRIRDVLDLTRLSRSQTYRMEAAGNFPARIKLSPGTTVWIAQEVDAWLANRIAVSRAAVK